jgi:hypothetical protein
MPANSGRNRTPKPVPTLEVVEGRDAADTRASIRDRVWIFPYLRD